MSSYTIQYTRSARKELEKLPANVQDQVFAAIGVLEENPRPRVCKKLTGSENEYRIRVGTYRVVYEIADKTVTVLIVRIRHRKDAY